VWKTLNKIKGVCVGAQNLCPSSNSPPSPSKSPPPARPQYRNVRQSATQPVRKKKKLERLSIYFFNINLFILIGD